MKPCFPATYSTLSAEALSGWISSKYATGPVRCKLLVRGVGDTYLIESASGQFILRIYRSSHRSLAQIKEEVELLLKLKEADVSVSYPIANQSAQYIQSLDAIEGERHAVLFSYAPGRSERMLSQQQLRNLGIEMARFHKVSASMKPGGARWNFDLDTMFFKPLEQLKPGFAEDPEGYAWLQEATSKAAQKLQDLNAASFTQGYCHFDFLPKNFHFDGNAVTFFDFDFMGFGWLVNDIMSFWQHLVLDAYTGRMSKEAAMQSYATFLEGYREQHTISEAELAAVPYLAPGFWLFYMGFHTTHDQFLPYTQPAFLKSYTGIMKNIEANYWEK
ncbi:phosphotransferase [Pseudoflavitalea sp. G-6-1-2]|uniref:phosphotransferase enzyme family protein n=1 Tax=Pseudoflavitalea sp. G-6-1-2 TaxID=2728841 RepID=UPI00146DB983|nr:phosphotransferase [Pseudoflavitalea sp. G-6-1-2]NML21691.1 phosphotransferase [Pseudoflavitalea sp. G-6-1-2]